MRLYGLMMLSLAFAAISCQKESSAPAPDVPRQVKTPRLLKAYLSVETKAAITDNFGSVSWNPSDSISVFDSDSGSGGNRFVTEKGGGGLLLCLPDKLLSRPVAITMEFILTVARLLSHLMLSVHPCPLCSRLCPALLTRLRSLW